MSKIMMKNNKIIKRKEITLGVIEMTVEVPVVKHNSFSKRTYTYDSFTTCGTPPQVVFDLLHPAHNSASEDVNVMVNYVDDRNIKGYDLMKLSKAKELFGL